jgi:hypothetical protein
MLSKPWYTLTTDESFLQLMSQPGGLTAAEAETRLQQYGPNELKAAHQHGKFCWSSSRMCSY